MIISKENTIYNITTYGFLTLVSFFIGGVLMDIIFSDFLISNYFLFISLSFLYSGVFTSLFILLNILTSRYRRLSSYYESILIFLEMVFGSTLFIHGFGSMDAASNIFSYHSDNYIIVALIIVFSLFLRFIGYYFIIGGHKK
jgi:hypothetical protein